jgi:hypothetical protein
VYEPPTNYRGCPRYIVGMNVHYIYLLIHRMGSFAVDGATIIRGCST